MDCTIIRPPSGKGNSKSGDVTTDEKAKWRLITGCADGQVRVWQVGDKQIDASIATKFKNLRKEISLN